MKKYIGVDIGKNGGVVIIDGTQINLYKMPLIGDQIDIKELNNLINHTNLVVVFEKLNSIFGTTKNTAFSMGHQVGILETICVLNNLPFVEVSAKTWQKEMFQGVSEVKKADGKRNTKAMAEIAATRLFPTVSLKTSSRQTKNQDGVIDALLIAEYAKRKNL
jgi:hypothetical protein